MTEMLAFMAVWDRPSSPPKNFWERVRGLFKRSRARAEPQSEGPHVSSMRKWVEANMQPGDELWEHTEGVGAYAIVRDGKVVEWQGTFIIE